MIEIRTMDTEGNTLALVGVDELAYGGGWCANVVIGEDRNLSPLELEDLLVALSMAQRELEYRTGP